jgi:hypothetical protein
VITADTITDEQILALRNEVAPVATPRPRSARTAEDLALIDICDHALSPYPEHAERRAAARFHCAVILNARAK